ncbi:MAG: hypothetical protein J6R47_05765 [Acholeplasmatales bacterium]|nr:hypothetical protein [Acholeplasmatales bacterium]
MKIIYNETKPEAIKVIFIDKEMEAYHESYLERKLTSLNRLQVMIENTELPTIYRNWCKDITDFIKEER